MNRLQISLGDKIKYALIGFLLLAMVVLYALEFKYFHLTFNLQGLILKGVVVGLIVGVELGWWFRRHAEDLTERIQLYVFFIVLSMVFMPLLVSLSNRFVTLKPSASINVDYVGTEAFYSDRFGLIKGQKVEPTGYYLFFYYNNRLQRIELKAPIFKDSVRGATITLPVWQGIWGHQVILPKRIGETGI